MAEYPSPEQGIPTKKEEKDIYTEEGMNQQQEDAEISPSEQGFMEGATGKGSQGHCAHCGSMLEETSTIEREIKGKGLFFCSDKCAGAGPQHEE